MIPTSGFTSPEPDGNAVAAMPRYRLEWYGVERYCVHCREYWPADQEFFRVRPDDGKYASWCRACEYESRNNRRREKP